MINLRKREVAIVFIVVFSLSLFGFYRSVSIHRKESDRIVSSIASSYIHNEIMNNELYSLVDESLYDSIIRGEIIDLSNLNSKFANRYSSFEKLSLVEVDETEFFGSYQYSNNKGLKVYLPIYNKEKIVIIENYRILAEFSLAKILKPILDLEDYSVVSKNNIFLELNKPLITKFHILDSLFFSFFALFLVLIIKRVTVKHHYDLEGLQNIVLLLAKKDAYTAEHSENVAYLSMKIAFEMGLKGKDRSLLYKSAILHDIGKIAVPEHILNKNGSLTNVEYESMKKHSIEGYNIVSHYHNLKEIASIVRSHHERMDGSGYPDALCGEQISLLARILAVSDVYDALTTDRPYRTAFSKEKAVVIMKTMSLDQHIVRTLEKALRTSANRKKPILNLLWLKTIVKN